MTEHAERERDIAQGLRTATGELIGGLHVEDYLQGYEDFGGSKPLPSVTSTSYDLGRRKASKEAEEKADMLAKFKVQWDKWQQM